MPIICHSRELKRELFHVVSKPGKKYNYMNETIEQGECSVCGTIVIIHHYEYIETIDNKSEVKEGSKEYRGKASTRFLKNLSSKQRRYKETFVDRRMFLYYNELGNENAKCYSNLRNLRMGLIDPDQGLSKNFFAA